MEKLIKLLNQHRIEKTNIQYELKLPAPMRDWRFVLSKEYGFIQRLVENDKINLYMLDSKAHNTDIIIELYKYENLKDKDSKRLLMLLSISDTPIDDLLLYLK